MAHLPQALPYGQRRVDRAVQSTLSPGLIAVLARMAEAALDAEDALAGGGNMPDQRDPVPGGPAATADPKGLTAKETTP
jgi:hypothetical protein